MKITENSEILFKENGQLGHFFDYLCGKYPSGGGKMGLKSLKKDENRALSLNIKLKVYQTQNPCLIKKRMRFMTHPLHLFG